MARLSRAVALAPTQPYAHTWYGIVLTGTGREEALARMREAERLDPVGVGTQWAVARGLFWAGRIEEALQRITVVMEMNPKVSPSPGWPEPTLSGGTELGLAAVEAVAVRPSAAAPGIGGQRFRQEPPEGSKTDHRRAGSAGPLSPRIGDARGKYLRVLR